MFDFIPSSPVWQVFWYAFLTAVATGLGAIPFAFIKKQSPTIMGFSNALAAGLMLGASFGLIYEGIDYHLGKTVLGVIAGLVFIYLTHKILDRFEGMHHFEGDIFAGLKKGSFKKAVLIVLIMTVHSAAEGIGIGTSFGGGMTFGLIMSLAIAIHNIPEGLAISAVLTSRGMPWWKAALWSIFTSLPQPLMAVPAFLFIQTFKPLLPAGLGFAAGAMLWLTLSEIIPDAYEDIKPEKTALITTLALILMVAFQVYVGE